MPQKTAPCPPYPRHCRILALLLVLAVLAAATLWALPLVASTAITYQGQLRQAGEPYTGTANLEFRLFDQLAGGSQVGTAQARNNWPVEDGLFQVELDFGASAFTEQVRYLEVRVNGTALNPRQAVRPSPMALFALGGNEGPQGPQGEPGADGAENAWGLTGTPGTDPGSNFLGTLDDQPLVLRVANAQVARFEPAGFFWFATHRQCDRGKSSELGR